MSAKLTDAITYFVAVGLALTCIAFAGLKVAQLHGMTEVPADMGLNFPPPKQKPRASRSILVDPQTTQSIDAEDGAGSTGEALQPYTAESPVQGYRLLTVIDGVAFVEVTMLRSSEIRPVTVGTRLPGAGPVERIERSGNGWRLIAGDIRLVAERQ